MAADQLVGSEMHGFHTLQDLDIGNIVKDAGRRWLCGDEIYAIICNHKHFCVYSCPVNLPKSGAILLFDCKRQRYFRQDGHNWKKKKDGKTVNESNERLKVGNQVRIQVCYVHGQYNPTFARRCYRLLDKNPEQDIVLVHYRELKEESGDKHVYYAGGKDFLESTGLGDNLTVQNHEWRRHEIYPMKRDELLLINDSNNSTAPKEDEVSSFDQSNQIEKKRQREDVNAQPEGSGSEDKRRRFPTFWDVVCEFKKRQSVQNFLEPILESVIRRVVNEVFEKHLDNMKQNCGNEATTSESRSLHVNFTDNLSPPVFSGAEIEGEGCSNIQVALVDAHIDQQPLSYDGEASFPWTESPPKFLASGEIGEFDYTQQCAASPDTFSVLDEHGLDNLDNMGLRYDQALSFPDQVTSSLPLCDEDHPQFIDTAIYFENLELESSWELQCAVDNFLSAARSTAVAQMRWTKVFSVFKWFSLQKAVIVKKKDILYIKK
ncbi:uncharacterized protein LOC132163559 isoform X2 [Corylus avellana]|uniref:uncharacterized protein LOC132163559 isoform X2 n=1 Tax=Corylus avellana TaxID=13451 RepID=UPI002869FC35|nr:uncharacterized protein LOC132163559 isoform X2 [Corylus avellana]